MISDRYSLLILGKKEIQTQNGIAITTKNMKEKVNN